MARDLFYRYQHGAVRVVLGVLIAAALLVGCGHDAKHRAAGTTTTSSTTAGRVSTTTSGRCATPKRTASDGTPATVVATAGDLQVAIVDHGASVDVVSLFTRCSATPLTLNGSAATLPIGGSVNQADGIRCDGDRILVLSATSDDGSTYDATVTTYRLQDDALVQVKKSSSTIDAHAHPDDLAPYYKVDC
jgi:hypothetical protein